MVTGSSGAWTVAAVYGGAGAFIEAGSAEMVAVAGDGRIAVAGTIGRRGGGSPSWTGRLVQYQPRNAVVPGWNRLAIYDPTLRCTSLFGGGSVVVALEFSPDSTHLLTGTVKAYPEITISEISVIDLAARRRVHTHTFQRDLRTATWADNSTIDIVAEVPRNPDRHDDEEDEVHVSYTVRARDWADDTTVDIGTERAIDPPSREVEPVAAMLQQIAAAAGSRYEPRSHVWAVQATPFGVIAALNRVTMEAWEHSGVLRYRIGTSGKGCQLIPMDGDNALSITEPPYPNHQDPSVLQLMDVQTGNVVRRLELERRAVAVQAGGSTMLRSTELRYAEDDALAWFVDFAGSNVKTSDVRLGPYDLLNNTFEIRRARHLLALAGQVGDTRVVRVHPPEEADPSRVEELFAFAWDQSGHRRTPTNSGPGVFVTDELGDAIVCTGRSHGRTTAAAWVVRRSYPDGAVAWALREEGQAVAIDEHQGLVIIAFLGALIIGVDARTGSIRFRYTLTLGDLPVEPMSLACAPDGDVYVGTVDGRIVRLHWS